MYGNCLGLDKQVCLFPDTPRPEYSLRSLLPGQVEFCLCDVENTGRTMLKRKPHASVATISRVEGMAGPMIHAWGCVEQHVVEGRPSLLRPLV